MGQGTESCGGYEVDYDPYEEALETGVWIQKNGVGIHIEAMTIGHLRGAKQVAIRAKHHATFSSDRDKWQEWVDMFDREISSRGTANLPLPKSLKPPAPVRGTTVTMICHCKQEYQAREADLKRGWGKSCSKRCSAIKREYGRPDAKRKPV